MKKTEKKTQTTSNYTKKNAYRKKTPVSTIKNTIQYQIHNSKIEFKIDKRHILNFI